MNLTSRKRTYYVRTLKVLMPVCIILVMAVYITHGLFRFSNSDEPKPRTNSMRLSNIDHSHSRIGSEQKRNLVSYCGKEINGVPVISFGNECFHSLIKNTCIERINIVPNIVHYVMFRNKREEMKFYEFMTILSVDKFQKPCFILIHGDENAIPFGKFWELIKKRVRNIVHIHRAIPNSIFGQHIKYVEHKADVGRLEALREYGGIYLDLDQVLLTSMDPLREHALTLCVAVDNHHLANSIILASKQSRFLNRWYKAYKKYLGHIWGHNSVITPYKLSLKHPDLIHVENHTLLGGPFKGPRFKELFEDCYPGWTDWLAFHTYLRYYRKPFTLESIENMNNTLGAISRYIVYGTKKTC